MTMKEKLEALWKYLLLMVLVYGFYQIGRPHPPMFFDHDLAGSSEHGLMWISDDDDDLDEMMINVEVEKHADGDSTIVVTINGETVDLEDIDLKMLEHDDGQVFIKKIKLPKQAGERQVKIIKKKLSKTK